MLDICQSVIASILTVPMIEYASSTLKLVPRYFIHNIMYSSSKIQGMYNPFSAVAAFKRFQTTFL